MMFFTGKGAVYGYDAVGSYKRDDYGCMGSGQNFIMPILDNLVSLFWCIIPHSCKFKKFATIWQVGHKNRLDQKRSLSAEEVVAIVKECFVVVSERDIYTGDSVEIKVIRSDGITSELFQLKKD